MAQNFLPCDRDQELLLPPSLREWLPDEHLAWFLLDTVAALDLGAFYAAYRADGHGAAAHDPQMMVTLLVYAYAIGIRSSRGIERRLRDDVAFRVIAANQIPDHATIARFRQRHERAIEGLFGSVLCLCAEAGLVKAGLLAIDGTKVQANASRFANRDYEQIAREILEEAAEVDRAEDERYGEARGDELPPEFRTKHGRKGWLREAKRRLDRAGSREPPSRVSVETSMRQPPLKPVTRAGRIGLLLFVHCATVDNGGGRYCFRLAKRACCHRRTDEQVRSRAVRPRPRAASQPAD